GVYDWTIDSTSSLKVTINAGITNIDNNGTTTAEITNLDGSLINKTQKTITSITESENFLSNIFYRKRFKKKGRTISVNTDFGFNSSNNKFNLKANNQFFNKFGTITTVETIDQFKPGKEQGSNISTKVSYTEPLWKNTFLEVNYRYANSKNDAEKNTFNKDANSNVYNDLVDSLSNHFIFNTHNNNGGFTFRYNAKKFNFAIGSAVGRVVFKQTDVNTGEDRKFGFNNFLPTATIGYTPTKQRRVTFTYNGSTRNPSIAQIQPIIDNIDPLNVNVGNPNLKQEFRNTFSLNVSDYKIIKSRNIWIGANFTTVKDAISSSVEFNDTTLRRENRAINVNGNYNGNMWSQFGFDVAPSMNLSFGFNPNISRFVNYINKQRNVTDNIRLGYSINLGYWPDKWLNFYFNIRATRNKSTSSINKNIVTKYWTYNSYGEVNMKLPKKWYITIEEEINVYEKTAIFANQRDIFIINASIKKSIDKGENWQIKVSGNDILKQNQSVSRNISSNVISETTNQNIQRFFLLTLIYNFNKNGKPAGN
ncbi:MAG: outer membrane beta-barrel protein, partial [Chitinophagaceae bacterium]